MSKTSAVAILGEEIVELITEYFFLDFSRPFCELSPEALYNIIKYDEFKEIRNYCIIEIMTLKNEKIIKKMMKLENFRNAIYNSSDVIFMMNRLDIETTDLLLKNHPLIKFDMYLMFNLPPEKMQYLNERRGRKFKFPIEYVYYYDIIPNITSEAEELYDLDSRSSINTRKNFIISSFRKFKNYIYENVYVNFLTFFTSRGPTLDMPNLR